MAITGDDQTDQHAHELTDTERAILDLERSWWKYAGVKDSTIMQRFGWGPTRYYQVLQVLIDRPAALAYDPMLVRRLHRIRCERRRGRGARVSLSQM